MSELTRLTLSIAGIGAGFAILGAALGFVCRGFHPLVLLAASVLSSVAVLASFDLAAGRLHWWWDTPLEVLAHGILPYMWLCLMPTWFAAQWTSRRLMLRRQASNQTMQRTAPRSDA
jgi:hypothetical protein